LVNSSKPSLANVGHLIVDLDAAIFDHLLDVAARTHARLSQHLLQLGRIGLWAQHALVGGTFFGSFFFGHLFTDLVELARQQFGVNLGGLLGCHRGAARCARLAKLVGQTTFALLAAFFVSVGSFSAFGTHGLIGTRGTISTGATATFAVTAVSALFTAGAIGATFALAFGRSALTLGALCALACLFRSRSQLEEAMRGCFPHHLRRRSYVHGCSRA
jgi:hypothetical protein